jgi:PhnB protein
VRITPHLCFYGQCEEAFRHYQRVLGGEIITMLRYRDSPMAAQVETQWHSRILHATLKAGELELTGGDVLSDDSHPPSGFFVTLSVDGLDRAEQVFDLLGDGGKIGFPFQKTFWSLGFGVLTDRFGVPWKINCAQARVDID